MEREQSRAEGRLKREQWRGWGGGNERRHERDKGKWKERVKGVVVGT